VRWQLLGVYVRIKVHRNKVGYKRDGVRYTGVTSATLEASSSCHPPYASFLHVTEFKNHSSSSHNHTTSTIARAGATTSITHDILPDFRTRPDKGVDLHLTMRQERPVRDCINRVPVDTATETNRVYPIERHCVFTAICGDMSRVAVNRSTV